MTEAEALCRGFLQNAVARRTVVARVQPDDPSADYLAGFTAGFDAGQVAALALALGALSAESPTTIAREAESRAAVDLAFPFELYLDPA